MRRTSLPRSGPLGPLSAVLVGAGAFCAAVPARAGDPAAAQALFDQARREMARGDYAQACPKFEESQRLDAGLGTQFQLANCWQRSGRSASAWALFREVESEAQAIGQTARAAVARDRAAALEPWLSKLEVIAPPDADSAPGLEIRRDGVGIARAEWNTPMPLDPGEHDVAVVVAGRQPWRVRVDVPDDGKTATVQAPPVSSLPSLTPGADAARPAAPARFAEPPAAPPAQPPAPVAPAEAPAVPPAQPAAPGERPQPIPPPGAAAPMPNGASPFVLPSATRVADGVDSRGVPQRAIGWLVFGAGVVGLAASAYFGVRWLDDETRSKSHCPNQCDAFGRELRDDASNFGIDAIATASAGAVVTLVGATLVATAPVRRSEIRETGGVSVAPWSGAHLAGLRVDGWW